MLPTCSVSFYVPVWGTSLSFCVFHLPKNHSKYPPQSAPAQTICCIWSSCVIYNIVIGFDFFKNFIVCIQSHSILCIWGSLEKANYKFGTMTLDPPHDFWLVQSEKYCMSFSSSRLNLKQDEDQRCYRCLSLAVYLSMLFPTGFESLPLFFFVMYAPESCT